MRPSPDCSPTILVFPCLLEPDSSRRSPSLRASNVGDTLFSQLRGDLWRIRSYKRSVRMSATAFFVGYSQIHRSSKWEIFRHTVCAVYGPLYCMMVCGVCWCIALSVVAERTCSIPSIPLASIESTNTNCAHRDISTYHSNQLPVLNSAVHSYSTKSSSDLHLLSPQTAVGKKLIQFKTSQLLNKLPDQIKL